MLVHELIEALNHLPPDWPVVVKYPEGHRYEPDDDGYEAPVVHPMQFEEKVWIE